MANNNIKVADNFKNLVEKIVEDDVATKSRRSTRSAYAKLDEVQPIGTYVPTGEVEFAAKKLGMVAHAEVDDPKNIQTNTNLEVKPHLITALYSREDKPLISIMSDGSVVLDSSLDNSTFASEVWKSISDFFPRDTAKQIEAKSALVYCTALLRKLGKTNQVQNKELQDEMAKVLRMLEDCFY